MRCALCSQIVGGQTRSEIRICGENLAGRGLHTRICLTLYLQSVENNGPERLQAGGPGQETAIRKQQQQPLSPNYQRETIIITNPANRNTQTETATIIVYLST